MALLHQQDPTRYPRDGRHGFHMSEADYVRDVYTLLFSHPADYTPVCTTELGRVAALPAALGGGLALAAPCAEGWEASLVLDRGDVVINFILTPGQFELFPAYRWIARQRGIEMIRFDG